MYIRLIVGICFASIALAAPVTGQQAPAAAANPVVAPVTPPLAQSRQPASITGTVSDSNDGIVPGAHVTLTGSTPADS